MNTTARIGLIASISTAAVQLASPATAQPGWIDITKEVERVIGKQTPETDYYLKSNSIKNIKSVNFKDTNYRQAIFSFVGTSTTSRRTYSFDCAEYSYKLDSQTPGYWHSLNWITPGYDQNNFTWFAFKYLCGEKPDPWKLVSESVDGEKLYLNIKTAYSTSISRQGKVYSFVAINIKPSQKNQNYENSRGSIQWPELPSFPSQGDADYGDGMRRVYVACKTKSIGIYTLTDASGDSGILLDEANPGSVASEILESVCR